LDAKSSSGPDMSIIFKDLSKGTDVSKGLKKVTADMKSKNMKDKSSVVPATTTTTKTSVPKGGKSEVSKPPKFSLDGSKWCVEWQNGNKEIVISETEPKQTIYLYHCTNSTVQVKGKVNAITLDACSKTAIVFGSVVSTVDVVNCSSIEIQVTGKVPNICIDKTSGCQVYLSESAFDTEIVSSKSSEMNVLLPGGEDQDLIEMAIPEQFKTIIKDGKLFTESNSHV